MKRFFLVFVLAVTLNFIWENMHSVLYSAYKSDEITEFILMKASLFDALIITILLLPFLLFPFLKNKSWLIVIFGIIVAIFNEWYGLSTGRWEYNSLMPVIPIINVGISPTIQLGLLGYLSFKIKEKYFQE